MLALCFVLFFLKNIWFTKTLQLLWDVYDLKMFFPLWYWGFQKCLKLLLLSHLLLSTLLEIVINFMYVYSFFRGVKFLLYILKYTVDCWLYSLRISKLFHILHLFKRLVQRKSNTIWMNEKYFRKGNHMMNCSN